MDRLITVTGKGRVQVKPDYIKISMKLESKDKEYAKAMDKASERVESLAAALSGIGFSRDDIKTSEFNVSPDRELKKTMGRSKAVIVGFSVTQRVKLEFDLDLEKLGQVLAVIAKWSKSEPDLSVDFTVKDPGAVRDAVLESAAKNARRQADVLCSASGVILGDLVKVDYSWSEINVRRRCIDSKSVTRDVSAMMDMMDMTPPSYGMINPEDITANDSATFVWEIK